MPDWREAAKQKRDSVNALIPEKWRLETVPSKEDQRDVTDAYIQKYLTSREIEITETDAVGIAAKTTTGEWKALEVTEAFCHRAALAHQLVSCLHEIFFEEAYAEAKRLDEHFATHKQPVGPLHGLPVSLKDQFHVRGIETHMGYVGWIGTFQGEKDHPQVEKRTFESEMVKELRNLGAVLYVKTAVPHTLMFGETFNHIAGYVENPKNRLLSSGGSSGGEGALIGLKGSPVGFGTDIGGSIRIPAAFNGLYGLRPSTGRLAYEGMANSLVGQNTVLSVVGPLATTPGALRLVTKALLSQQPWYHDPYVHEIPWRDEKEQETLDLATGKTGKLAVGVMRFDGTVNLSPPVRRAVDKVANVFKELGHELHDWKPPVPHSDLINIAYTAWGADGGKDLRDSLGLSGEEVFPAVIVEDDENAKQLNATELAANVTKKNTALKAYMDGWNDTIQKTGTGRPIDFILTGLASFPAPRPKGYHYYGYSVFVNTLDYTSVIVPVTTVDKDIDKPDPDYKPVNEQDKKCYDDYDPEVYHGAHVGVQLVGRRLQEEKMIALAMYLSQALQKVT